MGNQTSLPTPTDKNPNNKRAPSKTNEEEAIFSNNIFEDGIDGLFDAEPAFENEIQHYVEVQNLSQTQLSKMSELGNRVKENLEMKGRSASEVAREEEIQRIINQPAMWFGGLDTSFINFYFNFFLAFRMIFQPSPITTDTLARDAGVVTDFESNLNTSNTNSIFPSDNSDRLASAIRWPIKKQKSSSRNGHHNNNHQNKTHIPKNVQLVTTFDNRQVRLELSRSHDDFVGILDLPEGKHKYKFLVDGEWKVNSEDATETDLETGEVFNVINIEKSDFDIFNALEDDDMAIQLEKDKASKSGHGGSNILDSIKANAQRKRSVSRQDSSATDASGKNENSNNNDENNTNATNDLIDEDFDDYNQEIPDKNVLKASGKDKKMATAILPPHLLQKILLNEQVHHSYEPSLLPEPQHVMLNHLYALAIRNGVMALSATGRYKKKFVTTLLYKPL